MYRALSIEHINTIVAVHINYSSNLSYIREQWKKYLYIYMTFTQIYTLIKYMVLGDATNLEKRNIWVSAPLIEYYYLHVRFLFVCVTTNCDSNWNEKHEHP